MCTPTKMCARHDSTGIIRADKKCAHDTKARVRAFAIHPKRARPKQVQTKDADPILRHIGADAFGALAHLPLGKRDAPVELCYPSGAKGMRRGAEMREECQGRSVTDKCLDNHERPVQVALQEIKK